MTRCSIPAATWGTAMDYRTLETLRRRHPAWRLLNADHAPLIVSFLHDTFIRPNVRTLSQAELAPRLEDYLFSLRADLGGGKFHPEPTHFPPLWPSAPHPRLPTPYPPTPKPI